MCKQKTISVGDEWWCSQFYETSGNICPCDASWCDTQTILALLWHLKLLFVLRNILAYTHVLQLQHSGGVVRLDVFRQQRDQETCVSEGHLPLIGCGPVLGTLFLSHKEKGDKHGERHQNKFNLWKRNPSDEKQTWQYAAFPLALNNYTFIHQIQPLFCDTTILYHSFHIS